jgi:lipopolysaccharide export system permease protein
MIKILDRYILRAFFTNYAIALCVMIGLYITLDLFVNIDEFTEVRADSRAQTFLRIADFYGHNLFLYFSQLAGVITLMAACFTLGRFHRTNELVAILASGTSFYRVATPIILAALSMNGLWLIDQEVFIPHFADKLSRKHADIEGRHSFAVWFQPDREGALLSATMFHPRAREMRGMIVIKRDANQRMTEVLRADRARWDEERRRWHLDNGFAMKLQADGLVESEGDLGRTPVAEYESDLTPKELALQQATMWMSFLSMPDLDRLAERFSGAGASEFIKVKHKRLTTVFINMALLCLGLPFFLNRERPSVIVAGGKCLLVTTLAFVFTFVCHSIDLSPMGFNPALPAWLPLLVLGPLAVLLLDAIKT